MTPQQEQVLLKGQTIAHQPCKQTPNKDGGSEVHTDGGRRSRRHQSANSSSSTFASLTSRVSNPSVNHPYTGANSSRACCTLPWSRQRRAMLIAARSSQDLAC